MVPDNRRSPRRESTLQLWTLSKYGVAVLLSAGLSGLVPSPAHAETIRRPDTRGDAPARIDIHRATYSHDPKRVRVTVTIPQLGNRGSASLSISRYSVFEAGYVVRIKKVAGKRASTRLYYFNHFNLEPRKCSDVSGQWANGEVRLSVARHCLEGHAANRVFAQFGIQQGSTVDRAPAVRRLRRG